MVTAFQEKFSMKLWIATWANKNLAYFVDQGSRGLMHVSLLEELLNRAKSHHQRAENHLSDNHVAPKGIKFYISCQSTPEQVITWLKSKAFSDRYLRIITGIHKKKHFAAKIMFGYIKVQLPVGTISLRSWYCVKCKIL